MTAADEHLQRHWFIGDSVIVLHGDAGTRVRVTGLFVGDPARRKYRTTLVDANGKEARSREWNTIYAALQCGEEWLP